MAEKTQSKDRREPDQGAPARKPRGFANMDAERQRQIASLGGRAAHQQGKAHEFTSEEAREAGRKGGMASGSARNRAAAARRAAQSSGAPAQAPADREGEAGESREPEGEQKDEQKM